MAIEALGLYLSARVIVVNFKRVFRLMKQIALMAIFPIYNLLKANKEHKIFPYLLREGVIYKVNEIWSTNITYIRMRYDFLYLG